MTERIEKELELAVVPPGFRVQCAKTTALALALVKLREEHEKMGLRAMGFLAWIGGLAESTGVSLDLVWEWAGGLPGAGGGSVYARVGDALGVSRRVVRDLGLSDLARDWGHEPPIEAFARRGPGATLAALEEHLDRIAVQLEPGQAKVWQRLEGEIARQAAMNLE